VDFGITFLLLLVAVLYVLSRLSASATQTSIEEEEKREMVREYLRKRRIDELYGRDLDE